MPWRMQALARRAEVAVPAAATRTHFLMARLFLLRSMLCQGSAAPVVRRERVRQGQDRLGLQAARHTSVLFARVRAELPAPQARHPQQRPLEEVARVTQALMAALPLPLLLALEVPAQQARRITRSPEEVAGVGVALLLTRLIWAAQGAP